MIILENKDILIYLKKRNLVKQYQKAKQNIVEGRYSQADFRQRHPFGRNIWYFRINKKYRAVCYLSEDELTVAHIDDHQ